jgi:hypothetical protein
VAVKPAVTVKHGFAVGELPDAIAFDGAGHILMTNHAPVTGLVTRKFSTVETDVEHDGAPLFTPMIG